MERQANSKIILKKLDIDLIDDDINTTDNGEIVLGETTFKMTNQEE